MRKQLVLIGLGLVLGLGLLTLMLVSSGKAGPVVQQTQRPEDIWGECWSAPGGYNWDLVDPEWAATCWYCMPAPSGGDDGPWSIPTHDIPDQHIDPEITATPTPDLTITVTPTVTPTATPTVAPQIWAGEQKYAERLKGAGVGPVYSPFTSWTAEGLHIGFKWRIQREATAGYVSACLPGDGDNIYGGSNICTAGGGTGESVGCAVNITGVPGANANNICQSLFGLSASNPGTIYQRTVGTTVRFRAMAQYWDAERGWSRVWIDPVYYGVPPAPTPTPGPSATPTAEPYLVTCESEPGQRDDSPITSGVPGVDDELPWREGGCYTIVPGWGGFTIPGFLSLWDDIEMPGNDEVRVCLWFADIGTIEVLGVALPIDLFVVGMGLFLLAVYLRR